MICLLIGKTVSSVVRTLVETLENSGRCKHFLSFFFPFFIYLFIYSFSTCLFIYTFTYLFIYTFTYLFIYTFTYLFIYTFTSLFRYSCSSLFSCLIFSFLLLHYPSSILISFSSPASSLAPAEDSTSVGQALNILCQDFHSQVGHRKYFYRSGKLVRYATVLF